jgi:class 3 adenylate cyclase
MTESTSRTQVCSVVFLDILEYGKKPVGAQLQAKQRCNELIATALETVAPRDRVVLDTGDGAAITFLGDPEEALLVAISLRSAAQREPAGSLNLRLGINLGPIRLVRDQNGQTNIIGDGINVAQRVMSFADPGQVLVSRSFYEVMATLSHDHAEMFGYVGSRTDKHLREHEVYAVGSSPEATQRLVETASRRTASVARAPGWRGALGQQGPFGVQRRALLVAPLVFAVFAGSGFALRAALRPAASPPQGPATQQSPASLPAPAKSLAPPVPVAEPTKAEQPTQEAVPAAPTPSKRKLRASSSEEHAAAAAKATVTLAIAPWGEVLIDGKVRGVSPPLNSVELSPGRHTIEIRNTTFPSHVEQLELRPGEKVRVRHLFR